MFTKRGRQGERGRDTSIGYILHDPQLRTWPATQTCALTGNQTSDFLVCRTTPNLLGYTSLGEINSFFTTLSC